MHSEPFKGCRNEIKINVVEKKEDEQRFLINCFTLNFLKDEILFGKLSSIYNGDVILDGVNDTLFSKNATWLRIIIINYLSFIRYKLKTIVCDDDLHISFPAFGEKIKLKTVNAETDKLYYAFLNDDINNIRISDEIINIINTAISNSGISNVLVTKDNETTLYGLICFMALFMTKYQKRAFAFDLSNNNSIQTKKITEDHFSLFTDALKSDESNLSDYNLNDRFVLSLYIQRILIRLYIDDEDKINSIEKRFVDNFQLISIDSHIWEILEELHLKLENNVIYQNAINCIYNICINRKYLNYYFWEINPTFFTKIDKQYDKLKFYCDYLVTKEDEDSFDLYVTDKNLYPIDKEQEKQFKFKFNQSFLDIKQLNLYFYNIDANDLNYVENIEIENKIVLKDQENPPIVRVNESAEFNSWKKTFSYTTAFANIQCFDADINIFEEVLIDEPDEELEVELPEAEDALEDSVYLEENGANIVNFLNTLSSFNEMLKDGSICDAFSTAEEDLSLNYRLLSEDEKKDKNLNYSILPIYKLLVDNYDTYNDLEALDYFDSIIDQKYKSLNKQYQRDHENHLKYIDDYKNCITNITHNVFVSTRFVREVKAEKDKTIKQKIENIIKTLTLESNREIRIQTLRNNNFELLTSKKGLCSIRLEGHNHTAQRLVFAKGDLMGGNEDDLYFYTYLDDHEYEKANMQDCKGAQWMKHDADSIYHVAEYKQDTVQERIIRFGNYPIICTGCAGSGKTLIALKKCVNILSEEIVYNDLDISNGVPSSKLVYLTYQEKLKKQTQRILKAELYENSLECEVPVYTINEFFKKDILKDNNIKVAGESDFYNWYFINYEQQFSGAKKDAAKLLENEFGKPKQILWTFFRGAYKGSELKWSKVKTGGEMSLEDFKFAVGERFTTINNRSLQIKSIEAIYNICKDYSNYLEENNLFDDNDLAKKASDYCDVNGISFEYMIIDEVQDLTEVQLACLVNIANQYKKICFFGDTNQSINPTLFKIKNIQSCFDNLYNERIKICDHDEEIEFLLNESYRIKPSFVDYINHLIDIRQEWLRSGDDDSYQSSKSKDEIDDRVNCQTSSESVIDSSIKALINNPHSAIICANEAAKKEFIEKYKNYGSQSDFDRCLYDIYEAKGIEEEYVLTYNLLKSNELSYLQMRANKKDSIVHRMIFNQLYVGCTRASKSMIVAETNLDENLRNDLLPIKLLRDVDNEKDIELYVKIEEGTAEEWAKAADSHFNEGRYGRAALFYEKSGLKGYETRIEECKIMDNYDHLTDLEKQDQKAVSLIAEKLKSIGGDEAYNFALSLYESVDSDYAILIKLLLNKQVSLTEFKRLVRNCKLEEKDIEFIKTSKIFEKLYSDTIEKFKGLKIK